MEIAEKVSSLSQEVVMAIDGRLGYRGARLVGKLILLLILLLYTKNILSVTAPILFTIIEIEQLTFYKFMFLFVLLE